MSFSQDELLKELDGPRKRGAWLLQLRHGRPAYEFLREALTSGALNSRQMFNAMHAIFRIRGWGNSNDLLDLLVKIAGDEDLIVRSEAVHLAMGLVWLSERTDSNPLRLSKWQEQAMLDACANGVRAGAEERARTYFLNAGL